MNKIGSIDNEKYNKPRRVFLDAKPTLDDKPIRGFRNYGPDEAVGLPVPRKFAFENSFYNEVIRLLKSKRSEIFHK